MKRVKVEEGSWVQIVDYSTGDLVVGQLIKYDDDKPFDENNLCFLRKGYHVPINIEQVVRVYPKIVLEKKLKEINPSKRTENES
jgi:hypothetical protein